MFTLIVQHKWRQIKKGENISERAPGIQCNKFLRKKAEWEIKECICNYCMDSQFTLINMPRASSKNQIVPLASSHYHVSAPRSKISSTALTEELPVLSKENSLVYRHSYKRLYLYNVSVLHWVTYLEQNWSKVILLTCFKYLFQNFVICTIISSSSCISFFLLESASNMFETTMTIKESQLQILKKYILNSSTYIQLL